MRGFIYALCCLLPLKALAVTPLSPMDLLYRLERASEQQSFQGSFIYQRSGDFATYRIWHQATDKGAVYERLMRLDGSPQEVVRQGQQTHCASVNLQDWLPLSHLTKQPLNLDDLAKTYELHFVDTATSRIAGQPVVVVRLTPRDTHRYAMELSIEPKTSILLKSVLLGEQGQLLERMQFLDFTASAPTAEDLTPSRACLPLSAQSQPQGAPPQGSAWHAQWLPTGFRLLSAQSGVLLMTYSDGFARFSVFLEPLADGRGEEAQRQLGPTAVLSRRLLRPKGDWMVTVVGEIPPATAERIALSIRPPPENH